MASLWRPSHLLSSLKLSGTVAATLSGGRSPVGATSAGRPHTTGGEAPPLARLRAALQPATTDVALADAVEEYLRLSPAEQRACWVSMQERCSDVWPRQVQVLGQRVAIASPQSLQWFASVRALCAQHEASREGWVRHVDGAVASSVRPLYGAAFVSLHQLRLPGRGGGSGAAAGGGDAGGGLGGPVPPAALPALLAQVRAGETVHKTESEGAFEFKFGQRRCVHALLHASDHTQLLAVLYTAFLHATPASMAEIDGVTGGEPGVGGGWDPASMLSPPRAGAPPPPTTAVFYSVSSHAAIARGMRMGTAIIYRTAAHLAGAYPSLRTFVTLSPIPEFCTWLFALQGRGGEGGRTAVERSLRGGGVSAEALVQAAAASSFTLPAGGEEGDAVDVLCSILRDPAWWGCVGVGGGGTLRPLVLTATAPLVKLYLTTHAPAGGGAAGGAPPLCRVAAFHLGNGARMARITGGADVSRAGLARSAGFNVNYVYSGTVGTVGMGAPSGAEGLRATMREGAAAYTASPGAVLDKQDPEVLL